jgi:hypothetical protein
VNTRTVAAMHNNVSAFGFVQTPTGRNQQDQFAAQTAGMVDNTLHRIPLFVIRLPNFTLKENRMIPGREVAFCLLILHDKIQHDFGNLFMLLSQAY